MKIKQYIVLRHEISPTVACIGCSHGVLASYLKNQNDPIVQDWISGKYGPFYKVICQARNQSEWDMIKALPNGLQITESSLDGLCIAVVFKPIIWDKSHPYNEFQLYSGSALTTIHIPSKKD